MAFHKEERRARRTTRCPLAGLIMLAGAKKHFSLNIVLGVGCGGRGHFAHLVVAGAGHTNSLHGGTSAAPSLSVLPFFSLSRSLLSAPPLLGRPGEGPGSLHPFFLASFQPRGSPRGNPIGSFCQPPRSLPTSKQAGVHCCALLVFFYSDTL